METRMQPAYGSRWGALVVVAALFGATRCSFDDSALGCSGLRGDALARCVAANAGTMGAGGLGGTGGRAGASGTGGTVGGTGGSAMGSSGHGGGGAAGTGGGPCADDAACGTAKGDGSLCVGGACTEAAAACSKATLVVVADDFIGEVDKAGLDGACFYRQLDPALAAVVVGATTKVTAFAISAAVAAPLTVPAGVTLEGRTPDPKVPVTLAVAAPVADAPLVSVGAGGGLKGFALDGKGTAGGIKAEAGAVRLEGPLTIADATIGLDLGGTADATLVGTHEAPVRLSANQRGVVVGATAKLALTGDGEMGGVTVAGTTGGAGVLVVTGGSSAAVRLEGLLAKNNKVGTVDDGTGAIEVREGRAVAIKNGVFEGNRQAVTLNGRGSSGPTAFTNVVLEGNRFTLATPGQGSAICGSQLGSQTQLKIGAGNEFPTAATACPPAQTDSCNAGGDVGHDTANAFAIQCTGG
jgi:hypothetical protein